MPSDVRTLATIRLNEVKFKLGAQKEAMTALDALVKAHPDDISVHRSVAQMAFNMKDFDKAVEHYSVVISVLNSKSNISCKIKNSDYFGYLKWEHGDSRYAYLKDLPRHAEFNLGDTIITSGYSTVFPEGVMVGTVDDMADSNDGLSYLLKVKLATNFGKISNVRVITDVQRIEQEELELKTKAQ
jgi:tetratricopeptide (TPR) repeat protein